MKLKPDIGLDKVDIYPVERINYTKETQTQNSLLDEDNHLNSASSAHDLTDHEDTNYGSQINKKSILNSSKNGEFSLKLNCRKFKKINL